MTLQLPAQFPTMNDGADFWYYKIGVNVLPCYSQNKNKKASFSPLATYKDWFTKELDEETFNEWKRKGLYENGLMIVGGLVYRGKHKDQYLAMIDLDNKLAMENFDIEKTKSLTLIEQHLDDPDRAHVYFYTTKPLHKKALTREQKDESNKPLIEIKGDGTHGIHIVSPSVHRDGHRYEITSTVTEPYATSEDLEKKIGDICKKYNIPYLEGADDNGLVPISKMTDKDFAIYAGENRHEAVMRYMSSKRIRNPEFTDDMILALAKQWNNDHCKPPLDDNDPVWTHEFSNAKKFATQKIQEREKQTALADQHDLDIENPLEFVEKHLAKTIVQDDDLIKKILRVYLSAYTNNPLNLAILAPSSDGKTYATVEIGKIFPEEDIIMVGRISPTALIHQQGRLINASGEYIDETIESIKDQIDAEQAKTKKERDDTKISQLKKEKTALLRGARNLVDLTHKTLVFLDSQNPQVFEMLKPILSHDKKEILYKTTTSDGSLHVKETIIRGWPAFIALSAKDEAKNEVWPEIETRCLITSPANTNEKYKEAHKITAAAYGMPTLLKKQDPDEIKSRQIIFTLRQHLTWLCEDHKNPVLNPFAEKMADLFPHTEGITMRHFKRLMGLINIETLCNFVQNPRIQIDENQIIVTTFSEVSNACSILGRISTLPPDKIKFYEEIMKPCFTSKINGDTVGVTSNDLADFYNEKYQKRTTPKQILENYLQPLRSAGLLVSERETNSSQYRWKPAGDVVIHSLEDLKSKLIEASKGVKDTLKSCLNSLSTLSTDSGFSNQRFFIGKDCVSEAQFLDSIERGIGEKQA